MPGRATATRCPAETRSRGSSGALHAAHARGQAARLDGHRVADRDGARPQRAGHHGADALEREAAVDGHPQRTVSIPPLGAGDRPVQGCAQLGQALARTRRHRHHLGVHQPASGFHRRRELPRARRRRPSSPRPHPRPRRAGRGWPRARGSAASPLVGGDHQQHQSMPPRPRAWCARSARARARRRPTAAPSGSVERREAELDGDAALLFLRQPVGVDAGERPHERGLAVIDVPGGADDHDGNRVFTARRRCSGGSRAGRGPRGCGRPRAGRRRAGERPSRHRRRARSANARLSPAAGRAAADRRLSSTTSPPASAASRPARPATSSTGAAMARSTGISPARELRVAVERERGLERGERQLVEPQRAAAGGARSRSTAVAPADDDARLRPAEQLVAGEADQRRRRRRRSRATVGSSRARARRGRAARRSRGRRSAARRGRGPSAASSPTVGRLGEADDRGSCCWCTRRIAAVAAPMAPLVVGERGSGWWCRPRRSRAPRLRAARRGRGSRRRSRPARRATTITSRPPASARERQQHRRGVVVDHEPPPRRRSARASSAPARVAGSRAGRSQVELEVAIAAAHLGDRSSAASASGARPRLVWSTTPVALITRRAPRAASRAAAAASTRSPDGRSAVSAGVLRCGPQRVAGGDPPVGGDQPGRVVAAEQRIDRRHGAHGTPLRKRSGAGVEPTNRWVAPACRF